MKSRLVKSTLREIRGSLGRYLAISGIIALGVVMFAGLKVSKEAMLQTGYKYLKDTVCFDYRLISTIGFDEEEIEVMNSFPEVIAAEGAVSKDFIRQLEEGGDSVVAAHSITDKVNKLVITAGRMPQSDNECVVDSYYCNEEVLGTELIISPSNTEDTIDFFKYDRYTIVGIAQSPYYLNYERGTTTVGDGVVDIYAFMNRDAFVSEYETEVFIKMAVDEMLYSEEYNDFISNHSGEIEQKAFDIINSRFNKLENEARIELLDARAELENRVQDAEIELKEARMELESGEEKLQDGIIKIADGEEQIQKAYEDLSSNEQKVFEGRQELESKKTSVIEGISQLEYGINEIEEKLEVIANVPLSEYQTQASTLSAVKEEYLARLEELKQGLLLIEKSEKELEGAEELIKEGRNELLIKEAELEQAKIDIEQAKKDIEEGWTEYNISYDSFLEERLKAEAEIGEAEKKLEELAPPSLYVLDRNTNVGYVCFDNDSSIVEEIADVFPIFFFAVAVLVCMTTMSRMIEDQRTQIGVLKALGYSEVAIMGKYMFYSGSAALGGAISGYFLGTYLFPSVIWKAYELLYGFAKLEYVFNPVLGAVSIAASLLCALGATYASCASQLMSVPANLIRPRAPKSGKRIFLEYLPFVWKRLKFLRKVSIRNVFRYRKRFIMMVLGISGCTALLVTAMGLNDSIKNVVTDQYNEISTYDVTINFTESVLEANTDDFNKTLELELSSYVYLNVTNKDIIAGDVIRSGYVIVPQDVTKLSDKFQLYDYKTEERITYPGEGEAVISYKLADRLGVQKGDTILLQDSEMNQIEVTIVAMCKNYIYNYVFITKETYQSQMGKAPEYKTVYGNFIDKSKEFETAAKLSELEYVGNCSLATEFKERFTNMMKSLNAVIAMVIICAAALAFIVLYNLTNINITERIREIATIKVLGFYPMETAAYVFRENMILTSFGSAFGLILGKYLHMFVMSQIDINVVAFANKISFISYIISIALTFLFAGLVNIVMFFKLQRINMAESLKSIE